MFFFFFSTPSLQNPVCMVPTHSTSQVTLGTFQGLNGHVWLMATLKDSAALTSFDQRGASYLTAQASKGVTIF